MRNALRNDATTNAHSDVEVTPPIGGAPVGVPPPKLAGVLVGVNK